jgi:rhamnosyltransferase
LAGADVCAVVVSYHPDADFPIRLRGVSPQVGTIVVVDNGSADAERNLLREAASDPKLDLIFNVENFGLARALNIGIQHAAMLGYSWVLLLDQDSRVDRDMVRTLVDIQASIPDRGRLAVVGSNYSDITLRAPGITEGTPGVTTGMPGTIEQAELDGDWEEVEFVITSGSLVPLAAYFDLGPFREEFFIDYVDEDYCRRAKAKGYRVVRSRKHLMSHAIGSPTQHEIFGVKKWTTNHSPDRRYYIARNNTVLLREYGNFRAGMWALKSLSRCLRQCKRIMLHEPMKTRKIAAVIQGWWDGIRSRMGPRRRRRGASTVDSDGMPFASDRKPPGEHAGGGVRWP